MDVGIAARVIAGGMYFLAIRTAIAEREQELARHIETFTLLPNGKSDAVSYKGKWKLPGEGLGYTDGAGRRNRSTTPHW